MPATAASIVAWSRPVRCTFAPSAAKALAAARPMPLLPPRTSTTLFSNRISKRPQKPNPARGELVEPPQRNARVLRQAQDERVGGNHQTGRRNHQNGPI